MSQTKEDKRRRIIRELGALADAIESGKSLKRSPARHCASAGEGTGGTVAQSAALVH